MRRKKGDAKEEEGRYEGGRSSKGICFYFSFLFFSFVVRKGGLRRRGKRDETRVGVVGPCE